MQAACEVVVQLGEGRHLSQAERAQDGGSFLEMQLLPKGSLLNDVGVSYLWNVIVLDEVEKRGERLGSVVHGRHDCT